MANGFIATKDKSKNAVELLISSLKSKTTVTNKELSELLIVLIEKLK